eukprot:1201145-Rhodomonas_salina.1
MRSTGPSTESPAAAPGRSRASRRVVPSSVVPSSEPPAPAPPPPGWLPAIRTQASPARLREYGGRQDHWHSRS